MSADPLASQLFTISATVSINDVQITESTTIESLYCHELIDRITDSVGEDVPWTSVSINEVSDYMTADDINVLINCLASPNITTTI